MILARFIDPPAVLSRVIHEYEFHPVCLVVDLLIFDVVALSGCRHAQLFPLLPGRATRQLAKGHEPLIHNKHVDLLQQAAFHGPREQLRPASLLVTEQILDVLVDDSFKGVETAAKARQMSLHQHLIFDFCLALAFGELSGGSLVGGVQSQQIKLTQDAVTLEHLLSFQEQTLSVFVLFAAAIGAFTDQEQQSLPEEEARKHHQREDEVKDGVVGQEEAILELAEQVAFERHHVLIQCDWHERCIRQHEDTHNYVQQYTILQEINGLQRHILAKLSSVAI